MIRLFVFLGMFSLTMGLFSCSSTDVARDTAAEKKSEHYKPSMGDLKGAY